MFFGARIDPSNLAGDAKKAGEKAAVAGGKSFNAKLGESFKTGLGLGAGIGAFSLLTSAIGGTVDAMKGMVEGAIADEASVSRLSASLKANIPAWDGDTAAIEANIKAKQRLGFDDETLRDSLAVLVGATHDVTKAQEIQNVALDLARFKKIDLKTASEALIKVEGGVYRSLKQLGIKLKDNATSTEALAAVQAVAAGQAEEYADTTAGSMEAMDIAIAEVGESIGVKLLPAMDKIVGFVRDDLVPVLEDAVAPGGPVDDLFDALSDLGNSFDPQPTYEAKTALGELDRTVTDFTSDFLDFLTPWDEWVAASNERRSAAQDAASDLQEVNRALYTGQTAVVEWSGGFTRAMNDVSINSHGTAEDLKADAAAVKAAYVKQSDYLLGSYTDNFNTAMGIVEARADLHNAKTDEDKAQAYADLAELGALSQKNYAAWLATLERLAARSKGKVHTAYLAAIADIKALKAAAEVNIKVTVSYKSPKPGQGAEPRAAGGPVVAGMLYKVNENTPRTEFFAPAMDGRILTHEQGVQAMGGGFSPTINVYNPEPRAAEADIGRVLRRTAALGMA